MIKWKRKKKKTREHFLAEAPFSNVGEQFRIIRTKLLQYQNRTGAKSILVTSPSMGEGKSFVVANLAIVFAELNKKVLIVEANLRNPSVHHYFPKKTIEPIKGEMVNEYPVIHETNKSNIYIMDHARLNYNPSNYFSNVNVQHIMSILKEEFDIVLVDAPHTIDIPEVITLLKCTDTVIGIANLRKTSKKEWKTFVEIMQNMNEDYLTILNNNSK